MNSYSLHGAQFTSVKQNRLTSMKEVALFEPVLITFSESPGGAPRHTSALRAGAALRQRK